MKEVGNGEEFLYSLNCSGSLHVDVTLRTIVQHGVALGEWTFSAHLASVATGQA